MKKIIQIILIFMLAALGTKGVLFFYDSFQETVVLKKIIKRLEADSRIAEVLVTDVFYDQKTKRQMTTIKFLEFDTQGFPLAPKYFTFSGNIIQFQTLVVRFSDAFVKAADQLRGKSSYLFWKVFMLDGSNTQEFDITKVDEIPVGYKLDKVAHAFEVKFWNDFWEYALDPKMAASKGVKNVQIEAPGTKFIPGFLYTIKIEHDGGLRIDTAQLPAILHGEKL